MTAVGYTSRFTAALIGQGCFSSVETIRGRALDNTHSKTLVVQPMNPIVIVIVDIVDIGIIIVVGIDNNIVIIIVIVLMMKCVK